MKAHGMLGIALTLALCSWLPDSASAQARDPNVRGVANNPAVINVTGRPVAALLKPDLACTITAYMEGQGRGRSSPIQNNSSFVYAGGPNPAANVHVTFQNKGGAASGFTVATTVDNDGLSVTTANYAGLAAGGSQSAPPFKLEFSANHPNSVKIEVFPDSGLAVEEANESNKCSLKFTVTTAG